MRIKRRASANCPSAVPCCFRRPAGVNPVIFAPSGEGLRIIVLFRSLSVRKVQPGITGYISADGAAKGTLLKEFRDGSAPDADDRSRFGEGE